MVECICQTCGKIFEAYPVYVRRGSAKNCSRKCSHIYRRKHKPIMYRDHCFTLNPDGYYRNKKLGILHRIIWKEHYGEIPPNNIIHHKDRNKENNDIDNLELIEWGKHTSYHNTGLRYTHSTKICVIEGCNNKHEALGFCSKHYQQFKARQRGYWL